MAEITLDKPDKKKSGKRKKTYGTIGELLAGRREELNYSVDHVAECTRLRVKHIAALEAMDIASLPGRTYALGFLKTYADFLGLDPQACADKFREQAGFDARPEAPKANFAEAPARRSEPSATPFIAIVAIIALIGWGIWQFSRPAEPPQQVSVAWPPKETAEVAEAAPDPDAARFADSPVLARIEETPTAAPVAAIDETPVEDGDPVAPAEEPAPEQTPQVLDLVDAPAVDAEPPVIGQAVQPEPEPAPEPVETAAAPDPQPQAEPEAAPQEDPLAEVIAAATQETPEPVVEPEPEAVEIETAAAETAARPIPELPQGSARGARPGAARVAVRAIIPGFLRIERANGEVLLAEQLNTGDIFYAPDEPGIRLSVVNAGGFDILVDGAYGGRLGRPGEVKQGFDLDPENVAEQLQ